MRLCHAECEYCWPYCHHALVRQFESDWMAHERELDLERELELNPFEASDDIEYVPLNVSLSWRD